MLGMFALSPLSGRLADWRGGTRVICLGAGTLVSAMLLAVAAPPSDGVWLGLAVFLLGYGWNLCWVGGSSLLSRGPAASLQVQLQGVTDGIVWGTSAVASLLSGGLLAGGGFGLLAGVGGAIALLPVVVLLLLVLRSRQAGAAGGVAAAEG
jgi:predicted MFS family arabinose efflux permease